MTEMPELSKDQYIVGMLSKIRHKKWENYVVNRIVHRLDDPEIEFVCQQYVARKKGYALVDLYFPQVNLSLEVDEPYHAGEQQKGDDKRRTRELVAACGVEEKRISVSDGQEKLKTLCQLNKDIDDFVEDLRCRKRNRAERFQPWDYESRFDPKYHIERGYIDLKDKVSFRTHKDAMRCFGYTGGHYQRAVWSIPGEQKIIWFPKFYENSEWDNSLSNDGKGITEKYKGKDPKHSNRKNEDGTRIVFAHDRNVLGQRFYRFVGEFQAASVDPKAVEYTFHREKTRIDLPLS